MDRVGIAVVAALLGLAACGDEDQRPLSLEYITGAILAPSCGNAQCHSQLRQADNYVFDTVENARNTIENTPGLVVVDDPAASKLFFVLTREEDRMPLDQPLPDRDIALILEWITAGAPGVELNP